ncbi:MAG TPA: response regulator [Geothrix sp.]|jgi:CheY-like chemotaxis protein
MSVQDLQHPSGSMSASKPEPGASILLVDDDALILESVGALLSRLGYLPVLASTGEEALALLEVGLDPILVILDMDMPGMGGARTLPWIRTLRPNLPVLIATGGSSPKVAELIRSFPRVSLMSKPYGLRELKERLA